MKTCPFCAEEIQDAAIVCKHCRRDLPTSVKVAEDAPLKGVPPSSTPRPRSNAVGYVVAAGLVLLAGWYMLSREIPTPTGNTTPAETPTPTLTPTPVAAVSPPEPPKEKWLEANASSAMDDSQGVSLHLEAEDEVSVWLGRKRPQLVVRCKEKATSFYMVTGTAASVEAGNLDSHTVRVRLDDAPAQRQHWSESTDNEALFAPNAVLMSRAIAKAKTLRLEFTPFNASPVIVTFDVSGFDKHVGKVAAACGWKAELPPPGPTVGSLMGVAQSVLKAKMGEPREVAGLQWTYSSTAGDIYVYVASNEVVAIRPRLDIPISAVQQRREAPTVVRAEPGPPAAGAVARCRTGEYVFVSSGDDTCRDAGGVDAWFKRD